MSCVAQYYKREGAGGRSLDPRASGVDTLTTSFNTSATHSSQVQGVGYRPRLIASVACTQKSHFFGESFHLITLIEIYEVERKKE